MGKQHGVAFVPFSLTVSSRLAKGPGLRLEAASRIIHGCPEPTPLYPPRTYALASLTAHLARTVLCVRLPAPLRCLLRSLLERSHPPENVSLPCLSLSAKFSTLSAEPELALRSKVKVPGSSSPFSTSNKRLELAPQSPRTARPLGFQLGGASVRNQEWARPVSGDVSWKLRCC